MAMLASEATRKKGMEEPMPHWASRYLQTQRITHDVRGRGAWSEMGARGLNSPTIEVVFALIAYARHSQERLPVVYWLNNGMDGEEGGSVALRRICEVGYSQLNTVMQYD